MPKLITSNSLLIQRYYHIFISKNRSEYPPKISPGCLCHGYIHGSKPHQRPSYSQPTLPRIKRSSKQEIEQLHLKGLKQVKQEFHTQHVPRSHRNRQLNLQFGHRNRQAHDTPNRDPVPARRSPPLKMGSVGRRRE